MEEHIARALQNTAKWLEALVAMDTRNGTGDEVACVKFLAEGLKTHAPDQLIVDTAPRSRSKADSGYVMARWGEPKILLNVHIDTVPSGDGWHSDPHQLVRDGAKFIGLGTSDIKGAAACIMAGLDDVVPENVAILFSGDEEHGSEIMPAVISRGHFGQAPMAIICEPTSCKVGRRHRGMLAVSAEFSGQGGHSSLSDKTEKPLLEAARLACAIGEYGERHIDFGEDPYKGLCVNIGDIENDGSYNVIPTRSKLWASMRPPPGDNVEARRKDLINIAAEVSPGTKLETIVALLPFASRDIKAFEPVFGDTEIVDLPFWTEAALLSEAGVNAVVFGPGHLDQAHKPNEYVTEVDLNSAYAVYARVLSGKAL